MDGVLIDSEPFWQEAERDAFGIVGVDLTAADMKLTVGRRIDEVTEFWMARKPWTGPSTQEVAADIIERVIDLVRRRGQPLPGVRDALEQIRRRRLPLALASSSSRRLIDEVLTKLDLGSFDVIASAENELYGKPHPAVFLTAAVALDVAPQDCLVIEDSLAGVVAAKAARMRCLAVPDHSLRDDPRFVLADAKVDSLAELEGNWDFWLGPSG